jgi:PleD family two-component response regulator
MDQIRNQIKFTSYSNKEQLVHITMTFGLYTFNQDDSLEELITKTEQALYFAKRHKTDSTISYETITPEDSTNSI